MADGKNTDLLFLWSIHQINITAPVVMVLEKGTIHNMR